MKPSHVALLRIVGPGVYSRLRVEFAGESLHFPARRTITAERRRSAVMRMLAEGLPCATIAQRLGVTQRRIQQIASSANSL